MSRKSRRITISLAYFEHLLNCLANQKFLPSTETELQNVIDEVWDRGMMALSEHNRVNPRICSSRCPLKSKCKNVPKSS